MNAMAKGPSSRFSLADLIIVIVLCGLVTALFLLPPSAVEPAAVLSLLVVAIIGWSIWLAWRRAGRCADCGRRFARPTAWERPIACPRCGSEQPGLARARRRLEVVRWGLLVFAVLWWLVLSIPAVSSSVQDMLISQLLPIFPPRRESYWRFFRFVDLLLAAIRFLPFLAVPGVGWIRSRLLRAKDRPCEACGEIIPAADQAGRMLCAVCHGRQLSRDELRKKQVRVIRMLVAFVAVLGGLSALFLAGLVWSLSASNVPVAVFVGLAAIWCSGFFLYFLRLLLRDRKARWLLDETMTVRGAREVADEEGTVVEDGPTAIWYSGPDDPTPMLREQSALARDRFATILGANDLAAPPVCVLCFHDRGAFHRFHARHMPGADLTTRDGIYFSRPVGLFTLCTAAASGRVSDPKTAAGSLYGFALLEQACGSLPEPWLHLGLVKSLAAANERPSLARLNRKMLVHLARGTAWSEDLFRVRIEDLTRLLRRRGDPARYQKGEAFGEQSWSIVEYLCGEQAPEERKAALRAFLKVKRIKGRREVAFFDHFGFGFGSALDGWKEWVRSQGIGAYEPPPPRMLEAFRARVIAPIRDRQARRIDRIRAIRGWGGAGFVLGADALIALLREPGDIPKAEIVWALSMASGMAFADDPVRWQAWWDELPPEATSATPDPEAEPAIASLSDHS
jgi:hypothetical protein